MKLGQHYTRTADEKASDDGFLIALSALTRYNFKPLRPIGDFV